MNSDRNAPKLIDQSATSAQTYYSQWVNLRKFRGYGFTLSWGAVTTTSIGVEVSSDPVCETESPTIGASTTARKTDLTLDPTPTNASGSSGGVHIDVETFAAYARLVVVVSAGTGALYADGQGKE